jgi:hypothetical protein
MAERIDHAPIITPAELEEALRKGIPGAEELDRKLREIFRPPTPAEDIRLDADRKQSG